jgi:hypothetical protein
MFGSFHKIFFRKTWKLVSIGTLLNWKENVGREGVLTSGCSKNNFSEGHQVFFLPPTG